MDNLDDRLKVLIQLNERAKEVSKKTFYCILLSTIVTPVTVFTSIISFKDSSLITGVFFLFVTILNTYYGVKLYLERKSIIENIEPREKEISRIKKLREIKDGNNGG